MANHQAIIATVVETYPIPGADNIQVGKVLGENCVISKSVQVGDIGVLFPADLQLSVQYCSENNLFRHSEQNKDMNKKGFFDDNRRVRAQPFLKIRSTSFFASLESLAYTGKTDFIVGESFDEINGIKICEKYYSQASRDALNRLARPKQAKKDFAPFFQKHVDSSQFMQNAMMIPKGALLSFHAKVHGTSHRNALTLVNIELPKWNRIVNKVFKGFFPEQKWDHVVGTRNVVLTPGKDGFHGSEQFRYDAADTVKPFMVNGMTIYGEIAGYANGTPIMQVHNGKDTKDKAFAKKYGDKIVYKYGCAEHEFRFHVYRITMLNHNGDNVDFSQKQLESWCDERGILRTVDVAPQELYDGDLDKLVTKVIQLTERTDVLSEDPIDPTIPSEGIIVRVDTGALNPYFLKSKSFFFKVMEGMTEALDPEDCA